MAAVLWWYVWRRLDDATERHSVGWGLYLTLMYAVSLMPAHHGSRCPGIRHGRQGRAGEFTVQRAGLGRRVGVAPLDVAPSAKESLGDVRRARRRGGCLRAHYRCGRHRHGDGNAPGHRDPRLHGVRLSRGSLVVAVRTGVALVWAVGGGTVWWWHWSLEGGRRLKTGFADVGLVVVGILAAIILGPERARRPFVLLRLAFDRRTPSAKSWNRWAQQWPLARGLPGLGLPPNRPAGTGRSHPAGSEAGDLRGWPCCRCHRNRHCGQFRPEYRGHSAGRWRRTHAATGRHQRPGGGRSAVVAQLEARGPA